VGFLTQSIYRKQRGWEIQTDNFTQFLTEFPVEPLMAFLQQILNGNNFQQIKFYQSINLYIQYIYMKSSDAKASKSHLKISSLMMIFIKLVYLSSVISLK